MAINKELLNELESKRATARAGGGEDKLKARRDKGLMTARDRLDELYQTGTFQEWGMHADHDCHNFGLEKKSFPCDGVVTGTGLVEGRPVAAFSQDFTVGGGALGRIHSKKICDIMDFACARAARSSASMTPAAPASRRATTRSPATARCSSAMCCVSGVVPQIAVVAGPCAGGAAYSPALMDFIIMVKGTATMFICGPEVIQAVTGQKCTMEEIGSATANASVSGNVHFIAENDADAVRIVKNPFVPAGEQPDGPPAYAHPQVDLAPDPEMNKLVPDNSKDPLDVTKVIARLVDDGDYLEVMKEWAKNVVICFARIQGIVVGIVANQSAVKAGTLDIDASDKAARFIRFCNVFNIPIVTLVDVPGFMPGVQQERGGIIRHGAKMLFAYASATVPKITVIMRKAYGGAYLAMCSSDMGADSVYAWPTAEIAVMGAEGAVKILYRREITAAADPKKEEAKLVAEYRDKFCSPYEAAKKAMITDVISPAETRAAVSLALRNTLSKRETRPPKKHGTIPM